MFGFLKKRNQHNALRTILNGSSATYADFVRHTFGTLDNPTKAHILVAYQNLLPIVSAMQTMAMQRGKTFSIDDFIVDCSVQQAQTQDEINVRRYAWFFWAGLVYRLNTMSANDAGLRETLGEIWCDVARCAPLLKALLPDNVVWNSDERVWFENVIHEAKPEMVAWAINFGGPKSIWNTRPVKALAEESGLHYFEGAGTWGPLTYIPPRPPPR